MIVVTSTRLIIISQTAITTVISGTNYSVIDGNKLAQERERKKESEGEKNEKEIMRVRKNLMRERINDRKDNYS